jgi:transcriptional antiterminator RfaH
MDLTRIDPTWSLGATMNCRTVFDEAAILARYPGSERPFPGEWPSRSGYSLVAERRTDDADLSWYVIRTATRRERAAEAALIEAGFAVYVPKLTRWRRTSRGKNRIDQALFPGYGFVGVGPDQGLCEVTGADGVHAVVRFGAEIDPVPVSFASIALTLAAELGGAFDVTRKVKPDPEPGSRVHIIHGKFQTFGAEFVRRLPDQRIQVLLEMFGRKTPMKLKAAEVFETSEDD